MKNGTHRCSAMVVRLAAYRDAQRAAQFLRGCLHDPAWLDSIVVEVTDDGAARVAVLLNFSTALISRANPTAIDHIEVAVREAR